MPQVSAARAFVTNLLTSLPSSDATTNSNPLRNLGGKEKQLLLLLHVLYPNDLLPALDLLDRRLVLRCRIRTEDGAVHDKTATAEHEAPLNEDPPQVASFAPRPQFPPSSRSTLATPVYYVRSAQQRQTQSRAATGKSFEPVATNYEVRLTAWNCSCPAFIFAAFPSSLDEASDNDEGRGTESEPAWEIDMENNGIGTSGSIFGGLSRGAGKPPLCKHLLACVLVERCALYESFVQEKEVSAEEMAGWAPGWGD